MSFDACLSRQTMSFQRTKILPALLTLAPGTRLAHSEYKLKPPVVSHHPVNEAPALMICCLTSGLLSQTPVSAPAEGSSTHQRWEPSKRRSEICFLGHLPEFQLATVTSSLTDP